MDINASSSRDRLYSSYEKNTNKGVFGYILRRGHYKLEKIYGEAPYEELDILEIGGGRNPHLKLLNCPSQDINYYISDLDFATYNDFYFKKLPPIDETLSLKYRNFFDRIIACHVLEHIQNPEIYLVYWINMLKPEGTISILLPNDPGVFWSTARYFYKLILKKQSWDDLREYDYTVSLEHVNSIQNLRRIIKYLARDFDLTINYWPFCLPSTNLNLQTIVTIRKNT